jgi:2-hydroxychromene-2-carboxylate isomerase/predicted enzyme related to lactoylglutathione lyase
MLEVEHGVGEPPKLQARLERDRGSGTLRRMKRLTFYFDFISPYAYLAWTQVHSYAARYDREVVPKPVLFAALLDANGQKGPAEIPRKRAYLFRDITRSASRLKVPVAPPKSHPFNPLLLLRVASADLDPGPKRVVIDLLFAAAWAKGADVNDRSEVAKVLTSAGQDAEKLLAFAESDEAKTRVKTTTAEALELGAFGVPTMELDGDLFWGLDSFPNLELVLEGKDPLKGVPKRPWSDVNPSAQRKGAKALPVRSTRDVVVRTNALNDAAAFYEKALGFKVTMREPDLVGFETGSFQLFVERGVTLAGEPTGAVFELKADEREETKARLIAAGCKVVEEDPSVPRCYLADPYGFVFNLA